MDDIKRLGQLFSEIVDNYETFASSWKNIPLAKDAFELMKDSLPLRVEGELTPYTRVVLLNKMLSCLPERDCARFIRSVREYQLTMFPLISSDDAAEDMDVDGYEGLPEDYERDCTPGDIKRCLKRIEDYLNPRLPMEKWCLDNGVHLKFDPVERTEEWEQVIYDVEAECASLLKHEQIRMGYCFIYWRTKKSVLAKRGIDWSSPAVMNPRVRFD